LDVSHRHRAQVQAWVDGSWEALARSRRLFPPPERILARDGIASANRLTHVVIVRFPSGPIDAAYGVRRPDALSNMRLRLFEQWTLRSLEPLAAAGVSWFVLPDPDVPDTVMSALIDACGERILKPDDGGRFVEGAAAGAAVCWLQAGDALHPHVPRLVERRAAALSDPGDSPFAIEFPLCVEATPRGARLARDPAPACLTVLVAPGSAGVDPGDPRHPVQRLRSLDRRVEEWGVAALMHARPGPNEHPCVLRERGPLIAPQLLTAFGADLLLANGHPSGGPESA
jgi:hypothetical protein